MCSDINSLPIAAMATKLFSPGKSFFVCNSPKGGTIEGEADLHIFYELATYRRGELEN
jgi:hypothetical protein